MIRGAKENSMPTLLHVDSSPMGEISISRKLTREYVERWQQTNPDGRVLSRDLVAIPISPVDAEWIAANYTPRESRTKRQNEVLTISTTLAGEILEADEYVIGVPMHNWGPSSYFKLWTDQLVLFGETVRYTPSGLAGALEDKKAVFIVTAGRNFSLNSTNASRNHLIPWIQTFFGNLGVRNIQFIFIDGTADVRNKRINMDTFLTPHIEAIRNNFSKR